MSDLAGFRRMAGRRLVVAVCLAFIPSLVSAPVSADEVCDFLRKKIVWNYAIGPVGRPKLEEPASRFGQIEPTDLPGGVYEALWLELYADSRCSSRRLAEDLLRADVIAEGGDDLGWSKRITVID